MTAPPEPRERLPRAARTYWRLQLLGAAGVVTVAGIGTLGPWGVLAGVVVLAAAVVVPEVRWRRWRYEVRDEELDLRHGLFTVKRTLIPIRRVQLVDTESGPLQGSFRLADATVHTAAGKTTIPCLTVAQAEAVRRRVADLTRTRDDI